MKKIFATLLLLALVLPNIVAAQSLPLTKQLKQGQSDTEVSTLQRILNNLGKAVTVLGEETRFFGPKTAAAVKSLQCENGIVCGGPTWGLVGPATRGLLSRLQSESAVLDASTGPGLVAHYTFDEGTGTTANDSSGTGKTVTLVNGATWTDGKSGKAVTFPNSNSKVITGSNFIGTEPTSICAWVKPNTVKFGSTIIGNNKFAVTVSTNNRLGFTGNGASSVLTPSNTLVVGTWTHYCVSRDATGISSIYINGSLTNGGTGNSGTPTIGNQNVSIGNHPFVDNSWDGAIDDVRIYNKVLAPADILSIYTSTGGTEVGIPPATTNPSTNTTTATSTAPSSTSKYNLTIKKTGDGTGTMSIDGVNCGSDCLKAISKGVTVSVSATPASGSSFVGWSGACSGSGICNITMTEAKSVTALFSTKPSTANVVGSNITAASCSYEHVQDAINIAKDGDTVHVPAGRCIWNSTLDVDLVNPARSLTIAGAPSFGTVILDNVPLANTRAVILSVNTAEGKRFRLTGFVFDTAPGNTVNSFGGKVFITGNSKAMRIDNNWFKFTTNDRAVYTSGWLYGVIDHNIYDNPGQAHTIHHTNWDNKNWGDGSWASPLSLGTEKAIYIEDNIMRGGGSAIDTFGGARVVVRNNTLVDGSFQSHGTESSGRVRGVFSMEIYNNKVSLKNKTSLPTAFHLRGGTGVYFNNEITGQFYSVMNVNNYRNRDTFSPFGSCIGTSPWDKNDNVVYATGTHTGVATTSGDLVVVGKNWTPSVGTKQPNGSVTYTGGWIGYSLRNVTKGWGSEILYNTKEMIVTEESVYNEIRKWDPGDVYEIIRANICIDQVGRSTGELISGNDKTPPPYIGAPGVVRWPNQRSEPFYIWNNKRNGVVDDKVGSTAYVIKEGRDYITGAPRPGYTPYVYPHPLVSGADPIAVAPAPLTPQTPSTTPPPPQPSDPTPPPTTPTDTDSDGVIDSLDRCPGTPTSLKSLVNSYGCVKPLLINFDIKPDLTNLDLSSVGVLELGRTNIGKVTWKEAVALTRTTSQLDLDTNLKIERNKVTLISASVPELNKPAQITMYGVTQTNPTIMKDGVLCSQPTCIVNSFSNGKLIFTVTGFSTYEVVEGVTPPVITPPTTPTPPPTTGDPTPLPISGGGGGGNTNIYYPTNNTSVPCAPGQIFSTVTGQRCTSNSASQSQNSNYNFTRNLTVGVRGDDVVALQNFLISQNLLDPTNNTGYFGPATRAALARWQAAVGITPSEGFFGTITRSKLQGNPTYNTPTHATQSTYTRNLTLGDRGSDVTQLQNFLISQSLLDPSNNTGYFGQATKSALAAWQRAQGISPAEGYFGALTRGRLGR